MERAKHRTRAAAALLLTTVTMACGREAAGDPYAATPSAVPVRTGAVTTTTDAALVQATGVLAPDDEIQLSFKIGGVVREIRVEAGARVRRGEVLAVLEPGEIGAQVARAQSGLAKAERDLARVRALYADSVTTLEQLQDAGTAVEVARADLQATRFNQRYAIIAAPVDGMVLRRVAEAGELAAPGAPVLALGAEAGGMVLRAGLADRDAVKVREGDRASVRFDAFAGRDFVGRVTRLAPAADPRTGTYTVEVAVQSGNPAARLVAGLIGRVGIQPSTDGRTRLVPVEAVLEADGDTAVVYTLSPDGVRAVRRAVRLGALRGDRVAVLSGLDDVSFVITDGAPYLSNGAVVRRVP